MLRPKPPAKHPFDLLIAKIEFRFESCKMEFFYFSSKKVPCSASIHPPPHVKSCIKIYMRHILAQE